MVRRRDAPQRVGADASRVAAVAEGLSKSMSGLVADEPFSLALVSVLTMKPPMLATNLLSSSACAGDTCACAPTAPAPSNAPAITRTTPRIAFSLMACSVFSLARSRALGGARVVAAG